MKHLAFAVGLLLLSTLALADQCSKPPTCPANKTCVEVGTYGPPKLYNGQKFLWLNSTTHDEEVTMGSPDPLTKTGYHVRACRRKKAKVLQTPPPGDETIAGEDDYNYSCGNLEGQPR